MVYEGELAAVWGHIFVQSGRAGDPAEACLTNAAQSPGNGQTPEPAFSRPMRRSETCVAGKRRLKGGCRQDCLPHKAPSPLAKRPIRLVQRDPAADRVRQRGLILL